MDPAASGVRQRQQAGIIVNANLRYWQAVLRVAEAELEAATTNSDLQIAARRLMRARRQLTRLTGHEANRTAKRRRRPSQEKP